MFSIEDLCQTHTHTPGLVMPKKLCTNTKSIEARERKQLAKKVAQERAAKEAEDLKWQDNDKNLARKQQKKEEEERKRAEAARRKAEAKALLDEEMAKMQVSKGKQQPVAAKTTRFQAQEAMEKRQQKALENGGAGNATSGKKTTTAKIVDPPVLEENLNRSMNEVAVARNVDEALAVLSIRNDDIGDSHPEKRMREAYRKFEEANLPRIRAENPTLRMSQWKQMLMKEWNKSPLNPFNQ